MYDSPVPLRGQTSLWPKVPLWPPILMLLCLMAPAAQAQSVTDERRCTGQWRATPEEQIAACSALIDGGHFQGANLAILHNNRGMVLRTSGDVAGALKDFSTAISLNATYARAYANRGSALLTQHDIGAAVPDLDQAIKLDPTDAAAFMT